MKNIVAIYLIIIFAIVASELTMPFFKRFVDLHSIWGLTILVIFNLWGGVCWAMFVSKIIDKLWG